MMSQEARRRELAEFVRSRRERRAPEQLGFPVVGRRRTPGLRREEVATRAGVSITWYTWLEQGRPIRVSGQVLGSLANALALDDAERAHLFQLAGQIPPDGATAPRRRSPVPAAYDLLLRHLDPNPAFVVDLRFDILAWNSACTVLYGDLEALPPGRRNVLWLTFTSDLVRALLPDWEGAALETIALFRSQAGDQLLAPDLVGVVAELEAESLEFRRLWGRREVTRFAPGPRLLHHPELGALTLQVAKLHCGRSRRRHWAC
jgi:transcriptional regulator with XRE-family HTH domain